MSVSTPAMQKIVDELRAKHGVLVKSGKTGPLAMALYDACLRLAESGVEVERLSLQIIELQNPGIDIDRVREQRRAALDAKAGER